MTDKERTSLERKFAQLNEKWKDLPLYEHGKYYEHKVVWNKTTMAREMFTWLDENCKDKFSLDQMEHEKDYCTWEDNTYFSFVNKDDAMHFKIAWVGSD